MEKTTGLEKFYDLEEEGEPEAEELQPPKKKVFPSPFLILWNWKILYKYISFLFIFVIGESC